MFKKGHQDIIPKFLSYTLKIKGEGAGKVSGQCGHSERTRGFSD